MHQNDTGPGYYQYYQSQFQNPNPNSNPIDPPPPHHPNPFPPPAAASPTFASAPPVASTPSSSDYSSYYASSNSSSYPPYPQSTDQPPNLQPLTYPPNLNVQSSNPSPQPYNFPHLSPPSPAAPYYGYDQNQASLGYDHLNPSYNSTPNPNPVLSANAYAPATTYGGAYGSGSNYGAYGDVGKQRTEVGPGYEYGGYQDEGVYQYSGGKVEPYGARGTGTKSSSSSGVIFDDYGRPIGFENEKKQNGSGSSGRIVKAVPKAETKQDISSGVQKYRVKLLSEGAGQTDMDVLCQVGLDGIRLLDTATGRTLRIYPLEAVTRCEVLDSYIFAFWAKTSVDMDAKRIRLKSNSYTTNNILDTVTAATFQIKEIGVRNDSSNTPKVSEQQSERKKGLADWVNLMKPRNEEKDHWVPDEAVAKCTACASDFGAFLRRHHCRNCGDIFCDKCTQGRIALTEEENALPVRVCDRCMAEVTQRLANAKQSVGKVSALQSHEDLARKLKEEMEKNRKTSAGFTSNGSGMRTKDVACPTCTVHLQVQVPASGSETIECSVCQHPFLVSAH